MTIAILCLLIVAAAVVLALALCKVSGRFSQAEEIEEAKRKWGNA